MTWKTSRTKGHNLERETAQAYRDAGFEDCTTSRFTSMEEDQKGVDLCWTWLLAIQCKNYTNFWVWKALEVIKDMDAPWRIPIAHIKIKRKGEAVVLKKDDWMELVALLKKEQII